MDRKFKEYPKIFNFPDDIKNPSPVNNGMPRRGFMKNLFFGAITAAALPSSLLAESRAAFRSLKESSSTLHYEDIGEESYWMLVKENFQINKGLIMLNAANLCPSPTPVQHLVFELTRDIDRDPSSINRAKFRELSEKSRIALSEYIGANPQEIAITRNTSEGNNIIISGLNFKPNDEVVIWDENHPTANIAWDVRAERYGFKVKRVKVPAVFETKEELIKPFINAINNHTRILCFSHVSNLSGIALPAKEICRIAKSKGILTHIDGAQTFGSHVVDVHDMGCDFYTGSSHKWFCGPKEVGILYIREERIKEIWPSIVGVGYSEAIKKSAKKFETLGQRDDSRIAAMARAVEFHSTIGKERIESRIRSLAFILKQKLKQSIPGITFRTPLQAELSGGVVIFSSSRIDLNKALNTLYHQHNIGGAVFGGDLAGIRLCPHIYNTMEEIEQTTAAVAALVN